MFDPTIILINDDTYWQAVSIKKESYIHINPASCTYLLLIVKIFLIKYIITRIHFI